MTDCFDSIIGFTRTDCPCFAGEFEDSTSTSGLFMDELPETEFVLKGVKSISDCGKTMGAFFESARRNAIDAFKEKVFIEMGSRFTVKQAPFSGLIGQIGINHALNSTSSLVGSVYEMKPLKGGILKVNRIYVAVNQTQTVTVNVYKAYAIGGKYEIQGSAIHSVECNAVANTAAPTVLETPLELPLYDDSAHIVHYLFLMERDGFQPMDNKASCGCQNQALVDKWLLQGGIEGADLNSLQTSLRKTGSTAHINGVLIDVDIKCSDINFICEAYNSNPFIKIAVEKAIQFEAASNLLNAILRSGDVSRLSLTNREGLAKDAAILHNKFKSRVTWIAENIDLSANNCFVCNTTNESGIYKTNIRL